jgi:hypothetical protein
MKSALIALFAAVFLTACQTTGQPKTPAEIAARACPPLEATLIVLRASPAMSDGAKEEIDRAAPIVYALCAPGAVPNETDLATLANAALPAIMQAVAAAKMDDKDKQNILLTLALAQVALAAAR